MQYQKQLEEKTAELKEKEEEIKEKEGEMKKKAKSNFHAYINVILKVVGIVASVLAPFMV